MNRDDEIAGRILGQLKRPVTEADMDCVRTHFWYLREHIKSMGVFAPNPASPRFSDEKKVLGQFAGHVEKAVHCIRELSPRSRHILAANAFIDAFLGHTPTPEDPEKKLDGILSDLMVLANMADEIRRTVSDPCEDPKEKCAQTTWVLLDALGIKPTKYEKYFGVAGMMWEALTGEEEVDMERVWDRTIDQNSRLIRLEQEMTEAGYGRYFLPRK